MGLASFFHREVSVSALEVAVFLGGAMAVDIVKRGVEIFERIKVLGQTKK